MTFAALFSLTAVLLVIASIAAVAIGANDNTMASVVGAKVLSLRSAVILGGVLFIVGAAALGSEVSTTIGVRMVIQPLSIELVLVVSLAIIIWMLFSSYQGYPISATHAIVGSIVGVALFYELVVGIPMLRWDTIFVIVLSWILSPLFCLIIAYLIQRSVHTIIVARVTGLDEVQRIEQSFGVMLLIMTSIICLSRGGNDVAKAVGLLTTIFTEPIEFTLVLTLGGVGMAIGLVFLGRRVVRTIGIELTDLRPSASFSSATAGAIVLLSGTLLGIPLAATHILIASVIGVGIADRTSVNRRVVRKLMLTAILTIPVSAALAFSFCGIFQMVNTLFSFPLRQ